MSADPSRFAHVCPVFVSPNIIETVKFYTEKLGFKSAKHYDKIENFATIYRDDIEFVIVQAKYGQVESNIRHFGAGEDAYIVTAAPEGIEAIHQEFKTKGVKILAEPHKTDYGSYEFMIEDIDGRRIGIGRIMDETLYFAESDFKR